MPDRLPLRLHALVLPLALGLGLALSAGCAAGRSGPSPRPEGPAAPAGSPAASKPASVTVAVLGDAFGEALAEGLKDGLGQDPGFTILPATHAPAGLADPGAYDWDAASHALLAEHAIGAAVIMIGANDITALREGDGAVEPGTAHWTALYGDRVDALLAVFRAAHVALTWVGLPIVADDGEAAAYAALNGIIRDRCRRAGAHYVDSWAAFGDEAGRYDAMGPDRNGRTTRLRTADGRDFTHDGVLKLASFVEGDLRRARDDAPPIQAPSPEVVIPREPAFDNDVNAQIRRELGLPALAPAGQAAAGPVIVLTTPPRAPGGQLATASLGPAPLVNAGGGSLAERALVEGRPLAPKAGRIDDFTWPRR